MIKQSELNPATHPLTHRYAGHEPEPQPQISKVSKIYLFLPEAGKVGFVMNQVEKCGKVRYD